MGGDRRQLPARARAARSGGGADAVAHPRAVRSAGGAAGRRALPRLRVRRPRAHPRRGRGRAARGGARPAGRRARARPRRLRACAGESAGARRRPARGLRRPRAVDLLGHACGAGAARHRRRSAAAGGQRSGRTPGALRPGVGRRLLAARVRLCALACPDPARGGGAPHVRRAHRPLRRGRGRAPAAVAQRGGARARADRPRDDRARVERCRLPRRWRLPRLPPPHRPPPQPLEQRRRRVRPRRRGCAGAPARGGLRGAHPRPPARRGID